VHASLEIASLLLYISIKNPPPKIVIVIVFSSNVLLLGASNLLEDVRLYPITSLELLVLSNDRLEILNIVFILVRALPFMLLTSICLLGRRRTRLSTRTAWLGLCLNYFTFHLVCKIFIIIVPICLLQLGESTKICCGVALIIKSRLQWVLIQFLEHVYIKSIFI